MLGTILLIILIILLIGALLLILALPMWLPIPAPGISVAFGVPLILVSAQLLVGRRFAWLPQEV